MSVKKQFVEVCPGSLFAGETEGLTLSGFICPYCSGRGGFIDDFSPEPKETECPHCKGTGQLKALVQIAWLPDNTEKIFHAN